MNAHGGDGARVDAPLTDYHDLRAIVAASRSMSVAEALRWWPAPAAAAVREIDRESLAELRRREAGLDVTTSQLLDRPDAVWTMTHPDNALLAAVATALLERLGAAGPVQVPERQYLAERQAPLEPAVLDALGWPAGRSRPLWRIRGVDVPAAEVVDLHLRFYAARPDIVFDSLTRFAGRLATLDLA